MEQRTLGRGGPRRTACLVVVGLSVFAIASGLAARSVAAHEAPAASAGQPPLSPLVAELAALPSDTGLAFVARPAELARSATIRPFLEAIDESLKSTKLGISVCELEQFKAVLVNLEQSPNEFSLCGYFVLRSRRPHDWKKVFTEWMGDVKEAEIDGQQYFSVAETEDMFGFWVPDERTVVVGTKSGIARTMNTPDPADQAPWSDAWSKAAKSPAAGMMQMSVFNMFAPFAFNVNGDNEQPAGPLAPFVAEGATRSSTATSRRKVSPFPAQLECRSVEGAQQICGAINGGLTMLRLMATPVLSTQSEETDSRLAEQIGKLIADVKITAENTTVRDAVVASAEMVAAAAESLRVSARLQARRAARQTRIAAIAAALNKYQEEHDAYPASVVFGPDGKTPHSWRVEILPYLEGGKELHARYRLNEAWDSDHNRQVTADGASLFEAPSEIADDASKDCGYFLITGKATLFDGQAKPTRSRVTDPPESTILVVEARRAIPWTRPEDIAYDPDGPLPPLGGNSPDGFWVGRVDGVAQMLFAGNDESIIRNMITIAGGDSADKAQ